MRISDWSADVCSSDLELPVGKQPPRHVAFGAERRDEADQHDQTGVGHQSRDLCDASDVFDPVGVGEAEVAVQSMADVVAIEQIGVVAQRVQALLDQVRSEEHTSELQSLMRISYAVFC